MSPLGNPVPPSPPSPTYKSFRAKKNSKAWYVRSGVRTNVEYMCRTEYVMDIYQGTVVYIHTKSNFSVEMSPLGSRNRKSISLLTLGWYPVWILHMGIYVRSYDGG